ncbi:MAG TPA: tetraacyldisaccharide 4'-kinase [Thermodesulfobacteriota bacterium]
MSFSRRIEALMRGEAEGLTGTLLGALSVLYAAGVRSRLLSYKLGVLPSHSLPIKVVSVGNLTVGGTGKTPVAIFLARFFMNDGKRVALLSRGYKGGARGVAVVSDGGKILMEPGEAGDEPFLMARSLEGVPVVVCADRVKGGRFIIERFSPDVLILDDAFQHIRLRRDINILLVDSNEGFGNGRLLPRGILREPLSSIRRADFALIKGGQPQGRVWDALNEYSIPYIPFRYRPCGIFNIDSGEELPVEALRGARVISVCGIANPASFRQSLKELGAVVEAELDFPDHHAYSASDGRNIEHRAAGREMVITTEKDGVKLCGLVKSPPVFALRISIEVEERLMHSALAPLLRGVL